MTERSGARGDGESTTDEVRDADRPSSYVRELGKLASSMPPPHPAALPIAAPPGWTLRTQHGGSLELRSDDGIALSLRLLEGGGVSYCRASLRTPGRTTTEVDVRRVVETFFAGGTPSIVWYPSARDGGAVNLYRRLGDPRRSEPPPSGDAG